MPATQTPVPADVTILVDNYEEELDRLWWVRLRGRARVLDDGEERDQALALLKEKYPQYRSEPPDGPMLAVDVTEVREWNASRDLELPHPELVDQDAELRVPLVVRDALRR